ncbi:MAG: GGDEF domain-containing protein [Burkholderiales bacterium]
MNDPLAIDAVVLPAVSVEAGRLRVDQALHLLEQAGLQPDPALKPGSAVWLQALVDGLCVLSNRDPLTGLANRRQFEATLAREIDRVARAGESAMLLMVDIDHFKRVNDTYGHPAGDAVIQAVGRALQDCVRPMDTVARIGGEEFAAVLPNCPPAFGQMVAERVRRSIEALPIRLEGHPPLKVTISLGGSFAPQWVRSSCQLWMERADQQLYRAKREGRNRACLEAPPVSDVSAEERGLLFSLPTAPAPDDFGTPS